MNLTNTMSATLMMASASLFASMSQAQSFDKAQLTRGFMLEHGNVAASGVGSVDVLVDSYQTQAGVRLGLGDFEVVLNGAKVGEASRTDALVKYALPQQTGLAEIKHRLALYGGVAALHESDSTGGEKYLNALVGGAMTADLNGLLVNTSAELVFDDNAQPDHGSKGHKVYANLGVGAYVPFTTHAYGTFKPGAEVQFTTARQYDTAMLMMGVRWEYNSRLTVDLIPVQLGNADALSFPGQMRVNVRF